MPKGFKNVPGYNGRYQINRSGDILRKTKDGWAVLKTFDRNGYKAIDLYKDGKSKQWCLHRLMAYVFLYDKNDPIPFEEYEVHHINHDKTNCKANNLMLVTREEHLAEHQILREYLQYVVKTKKFKNYRKVRLANLLG